MADTAHKWAEQARYDFETAEAMLESKRYLYVLFCCQQAIEKAIKAVVVRRTGKFPPRVHNLPRLAEAAGLLPQADRTRFMAELSAYYIQTRYPEQIDGISAAVDSDLAEETLQKTRDTIQWLLSMLT